jgi:DNA-binding CsgD family transcriptional regulator
MDVLQSYYLLLIDLKESTKLAPQVASLQFARLEERLGYLNAILDPGPVLGLSLSYGDEVAGLFDSPHSLYQAVDEVRDSLWPDLTVRFVATWGFVGRESDDIRQVGGEIFKRASEAILHLKKRRRFCAWLMGNPTLDAALDSLSEMSNSLLDEMTEYQRNVYRLLAGGHAQKEIAARMQKLPQSVSDAIKRGRADLVLEAKEAIAGLLAARGQSNIMEPRRTIAND